MPSVDHATIQAEALTEEDHHLLLHVLHLLTLDHIIVQAQDRALQAQLLRADQDTIQIQVDLIHVHLLDRALETRIVLLHLRAQGIHTVQLRDQALEHTVLHQRQLLRVVLDTIQLALRITVYLVVVIIQVQLMAA